MHTGVNVMAIIILLFTTCIIIVFQTEDSIIYTETI